MALVKFSQPHKMSVAQAKEKLDEFLDSPDSAKLGVKKQWDGDRATWTGTGHQGSASVSATSVDVEVTLGLAASVMKGKIQTDLTAMFQKLYQG